MVVKAGGISATGLADITFEDADTPTVTVTDTTNTVTGVLRADDDTVDVGSTTAHAVNFLHTDNSIFHLSSTNFYSNNAAGPSLQNETASSTNPTLIPNRVDLTTGIGWSSGAIEFAVSGANVGRFNSTGLIGLPLLTVDNITMNGDAITFQDGETIGRSATDQMFFKMNGSTSGGKWQFNMGASNWSVFAMSQTGDGPGATVFNDNGIDRDFRIETDTKSHMFFVDGGKNCILIGNNSDSSAVDQLVRIERHARTATADTSYYDFVIQPGGAVTIPSGTAPIVATARFTEPAITATGTVTAASTVYIQNAPTEGSSNYALWVDAGNSRFDGDLLFDTASFSQITFKGGQTFGDNPSATQQMMFRMNADTSNGGYQFFLSADHSSALRLMQSGASGAGETVFNEDGRDRDHRIESDDETHAIALDAGENNVSFVTSSPSFGSGDGIIFIGDCNSAPSSNPSAGGIFYSDGGALKWRGSSGTVTTIAAA